MAAVGNSFNLQQLCGVGPDHLADDDRMRYVLTHCRGSFSTEIRGMFCKFESIRFRKYCIKAVHIYKITSSGVEINNSVNCFTIYIHLILTTTVIQASILNKYSSYMDSPNNITLMDKSYINISLLWTDMFWTFKFHFLYCQS